MKAVAVFGSYPNKTPIKGTVYFCEINGGKEIEITLNLSGLKSNALCGFHVHEAGDLTDSCESACAHFNPFNATHGCPGNNRAHRHVGDLGNIKSDALGKVHYKMKDNMIKLRGQTTNIIGRTLIIHADPDDCGLGKNDASLINGNSGKRIGCAIIGYSKENFDKH